jgi:hypothetical protein
MTGMNDLSASIDGLIETAMKVKAERDTVRAELSDLLEVIDEARIALKGCSDFDDNGDPNWAMKLLVLANKYDEVPR